jgi:hypothetical protein
MWLFLGLPRVTKPKANPSDTSNEGSEPKINL